MKSPLKIAILTLLVALSLEKPLQAALNPSDIALTIAGCTVAGSILGYLTSDEKGSANQKQRDMVSGGFLGFSAGSLAIMLMNETVAINNAVPGPRIIHAFLRQPYPVCHPVRRTTYTYTYSYPRWHY